MLGLTSSAANMHAPQALLAPLVHLAPAALAASARQAPLDPAALQAPSVSGEPEIVCSAVSL